MTNFYFPHQRFSTFSMRQEKLEAIEGCETWCKQVAFVCPDYGVIKIWPSDKKKKRRSLVKLLATLVSIMMYISDLTDIFCDIINLLCKLHCLHISQILFYSSTRVKTLFCCVTAYTKHKNDPFLQPNGRTSFINILHKSKQ